MATYEQMQERQKEAAKISSTKGSSNWRERFIESLILIAGVSVIIIIMLIFFFLVKEGAPAFLELPFGTFTSLRWYPIEAMYGLLPLLVGSLLVTAGAILISVPLGLTTAVYLGEFAPDWLREILKPLIEVLAGIPSIVLGFLGWVALAPIIQSFGAPSGLTAFTGALILAYMALPTIISITEDALYAVPKEYRDGSLAIGATKWQTIWRVVIPAAIGETMAVMLVTGNAANIPEFGAGMIFQPIRTMTATIAAEMGEVAQGSTHYSVLFAIGIVLFLITFLINSLATKLVGGRNANPRGAQL